MEPLRPDQQRAATLTLAEAFATDALLELLAPAPDAPRRHVAGAVHARAGRHGPDVEGDVRHRGIPQAGRGAALVPHDRRDPDGEAGPGTRLEARRAGDVTGGRGRRPLLPRDRHRLEHRLLPEAGVRGD